MRQLRTHETDEFPRFGARARTWARFERDLCEWLESPEGRFATWRAAAAVTAPPEGETEPDRR